MITWKDIQRHLGGLKIDGIPGPLTAAAAASALGLNSLVSARTTWRIVQDHLDITVDGIPGPETLGAVTEALNLRPPKDTAGPGELDPYGLARTHLGTREIPGKRHNPKIVNWLRRIATWVNDDETAWCSAFVDHCARETGREHSGKLNARSWLKIGEPVSLSEARPGDVVIFWRGSRDSWTGHVAFLEHVNFKRGIIYCLGGNQGNEVNISGYPRARLLGVRRLRSLDRLQGRSSKLV